MTVFSFTNLIHSKPTQRVGFVVKTHGFKGAVKIAIDIEEFEDELEKSEFLLLEREGRWVPYYIEEPSLDNMTVKLLDFNNENEAKDIVGLNILRFNENYNNENQNDFNNLNGFNLFDQNNNLIGEIIGLQQHSHNILLEVLHNNIEVLIPIHSALIIDINESKKKLTLEIAEGLLDIF